MFQTLDILHGPLIAASYFDVKWLEKIYLYLLDYTFCLFHLIYRSLKGLPMNSSSLKVAEDKSISLLV